METSASIARAGYSALDMAALTLLVASLSVVIGTRILTGVAARSRKPNEPQLLPYWIPHVGHAFPIALRKEWLEEAIMKNAGEPGFKLILFGRTFNFVTSPTFIESMSSQKESISFKESSDYFSQHLFKASKLENAPCSTGLFAGHGWMSPMTPDIAQSFCVSVVNRVQKSMPDLVSFLESAVDQQPWEKGCNEEPELGSRTAFVDLYPLIRDYVGYNLTAELMGSCFMNAYEVVLKDIWLFNNKFDPIVLGIPRYVPVPGIVPSYKAQQRLLEGLEIFHKAFRKVEKGGDPGLDWRDLDDVSTFMRDRAAAWIKAGVDERIAASEDLSILWAMNTEVTNLVFWQIIYILSKDDVYDRVIEEIAPFAKAFRPESQFKMLEPMQLTLDAEGLSGCKYLKASLYETVRLTATEFIIGRAKEQFDVKGPQTTSKPQFQPSIRIQEGDYVAALVNSSGTNGKMQDSEAPKSFDPEKLLSHILTSENQTLGSEFKNGPLFESDTTKPLEERIILSFVAAFLALWDVDPAKGQPLVPKSTSSPLVKVPEGNYRALIEPNV